MLAGKPGMRMKILIVEDDRRTAEFIAKGLSQAGFSVRHAADGEEGLQCALAESYDAAVVDIMLPGMDGLALVQELRRKKSGTPVIVLSAKSSIDDRIRGLQAGGDDYLVKPFAFSELLTRIQALIRRANRSSEPTGISVGSLRIDLVKRRVFRGDREIELQPREFSLLEYLMRNAGRVVSKTMIIEHVWDYQFDPHTNIVEARICRLRDKIEGPGGRKLIRTVRGAGYLLEDTD
jgi:two-component system, OmpR family, response regulator